MLTEKNDRFMFLPDEFTTNESFDKKNIVGYRYLGYWVHFRGATHLRTNLPLQVDLSYLIIVLVFPCWSSYTNLFISVIHSHRLTRASY